jgi:hypothetical protein
MHKLQPNQKVRILTLQIAVPADEKPSVIADELSEMLTGAIAEETSNILDWQYVLPDGGPKTDNVVTVPDDPEEGEAFLPDTFYIEEFSPTPKRRHKQQVVMSGKNALELISILAKAIPNGEYLLIDMYGKRRNVNLDLAREAGAVIRANPKRRTNDSQD